MAYDTDKTGKDSDIHATAVKQYRYAYEADRDNRLAAYDDLAFRAGSQWDSAAERVRKAGDRPVLTVNMIPKFTRQVTGDIRQMRPAIRVMGVDSTSDPKTAEVFQDVIRYIERRSDAPYAYFKAVDSMVTCGIGGWRIETEASDAIEGVQEIRISPIKDFVSVVVDPDSEHHLRLDARFAFVPSDFTFEAFKERFPDAQTSGFDSIDAWASHFRSNAIFGNDIPWSTTDSIRVLEYFCRKPDGKVYRYLINATEILEGPVEVPSRYIPVIPIMGEEVSIGDKTVRSGMVRMMRDGQRMFNYMLSAQAEVVALQPKAPWLVTEKNVERYEETWRRANTDNIPFLPYEPDALNGGQAPQRAQPPVAASGIELLAERAMESLKDVTGIYDASLGARSNEQSGKAILARQREGDTGSFHFVESFTRGLRLTGMVLVDMIPRIYDTARVLRVVGEDGRVNEVKINQSVMENGGIQAVYDLTVGKYDVTVESGPSYTTKRDEAREGMSQMMQAAPQILPLIADLFVSAQDWPEKEKFAKRLQSLLPPEIRAQEEQEAGDGMQPMQPPVPQGPPPEVLAQMQAQQMAMQAEQAKMQMDMQAKEMDLAKRQIELESARQASELKIAEMQAAAMSKAEQTRLDLMAQEARIVTEIALRGGAEGRENNADVLRQALEIIQGAIANLPAPQPVAPPIGPAAEIVGDAFMSGNLPPDQAGFYAP